MMMVMNKAWYDEAALMLTRQLSGYFRLLPALSTSLSLFLMLAYVYVILEILSYCILFA
jgi:hypothetical protein